mgnify:FL=1
MNSLNPPETITPGGEESRSAEPYDTLTSVTAPKSVIEQATTENVEPRDATKLAPNVSEPESAETESEMMTLVPVPKSTKSESEMMTLSALPDPKKGIVDNYAGQAIVPPSNPWTPPGGVTHDVMQWLGWVMYVGLALSMLSIMMMGIMMMIDRNRGEPMSVSDVQITAMRIAIGLFFITGAASLATFFA